MATIQWTSDAHGHRVVMAGMITSSTDFDEVTRRASGSTVTFDVAGVRAFTSSGIQAWLESLRHLREAGTRLVFERCSPAVVRQTMSIQDFLAGGAVTSVVAPYLCEACGADIEEEIATVDAPKKLAPRRRCTCGAEMELDDLPQPYETLLREAAASLT